MVSAVTRACARRSAQDLKWVDAVPSNRLKVQVLATLVGFVFVLGIWFAFFRTRVVPVLLPSSDSKVQKSSHKRDVGVCAVYPYNDSDNMDGVSTNVIESFEGMVTTLYVPAEMSGPTIGAGLDLGTAGDGTVRATLQGLVSQSDLDDMLTAHGLHGAQARRWVAQHQNLKLDSCVLNAIVQRQCRRYWHYLVSARPWMASAPSEVKTASLSFFMHLGTLDPFSRELAARDWNAFAAKLETFHDSVTGEVAANWQRRRHLEARLIRLAGTHPTIDPD